ncbi:MAG: LarC family nickel insertion protein [Planctomycetota bacterium]
MHRHADHEHQPHPPHDAEPSPPVRTDTGGVTLHADAQAFPQRLGRSKRHLHLDPFSGIAGDMFLGALLDLHDDPSTELTAIDAALRSLELDDPFELTLGRVQRCGVGGLDLKVKTPHHHHHHHHEHASDAGHHHHHHVGYTEIMAMVGKLEASGALSPSGVDRATRVVTCLANAEARVHGTTREAIHFHEVGAVDSIVDMLGSVIALERLAIDTVSSGPLPMSRGYVKCDHGLMPVPAPATTYLLQGVPTVGVDRTGELVTPTGAALLAGLVDAFVPAPPMTLDGVGYGAGDRDDPLVPNLLRVFLGTPSKTKPTPMKPAPSSATALV